jgi:hypothetical protein
MLEAIQDRTLKPEKESRLVRNHSFVMMQRLLEQPTGENLKAVKRGAELVD